MIQLNFSSDVTHLVVTTLVVLLKQHLCTDLCKHCQEFMAQSLSGHTA